MKFSANKDIKVDYIIPIAVKIIAIQLRKNGFLLKPQCYFLNLSGGKYQQYLPIMQGGGGNFKNFKITDKN